MSLPDGTEQFQQEVFPAELEEINKRRGQLRLPEVPNESAPSAKLGLVGLALSGGGLRSSTFSLGVIQSLAKHGLLKSVDYLSTVSGGGFIGSCLSSVLNDSNVGPQQDRFPLHYKAGSKEPLAVGQLRQGARYLAPGGVLDKLRIPALMLRGVLSNLFIFLFLILLFVFVTEFVYEVGSRVRLRYSYLALGGIAVFLIMVMVSPIFSRILRGRLSWARRNFEEMTFTLVLAGLLAITFLVPTFILVNQLIDVSWIDLKESMTANLLRPFESRDYLQWLLVLALLIMFMLAGRASHHVAQWEGKIMLFILGLLGPVFLFFIYLSLLAMEVDSPFISPKELFSLDSAYGNQLGDMVKISPDLRKEFKENHIRLAAAAEVLTIQEDFRWLIHDGDRGFALKREAGGVGVYPDYQYALNRGYIPPGLRTLLARKGYRLGTQTRSVPELSDNRFKIFGSHVYWIVHDPASGEWSLEQIVAGPTLTETLESISYTIQMVDALPGVLLHERVSLSEDDLGQAIRFIEEGHPHDVVLVLDNSTPPFADQEGFKLAFREAFEKALASIRPTVRMAIFGFDEYVYEIGNLKSLTTETKKVLLQRLFGEEAQAMPQLDFQGQRSNSPAALERAMREFREKGRDGVRKSMVFLSDGFIEVAEKRHSSDLQNWIEKDFAQDAQRAGIRLYGIALSEQAKFNLFTSLARKTGGAFYPVFESRAGAGFDDLSDAMEKLKVSAGSHLVSPLDQVTLTDRRRGTRYALTRTEDGIRIRAVLRDHHFTPGDLSNPIGPWRDIFGDNGIELDHEATISKISDGRWEVKDPYQYTISRQGRRLKVRKGTEDWGEGFSGLLRAGIPSSLWDGRTDWVLLGAFGLLFIYWLTVDINQTAAHGFYRDRLSKAFLFRVTPSGAVEHHDKQDLSQLNREGSAAPYHLINVALNLQGSKDPSLRGRVCDFFIFSKRYIGSFRTGFVKTKEMEEYDGNLDLGTAMAISGAAAAPNAGVTTKKSLVFIMTLLNARLGYWLPNPQVANDASWLTRLGLRRGPGPKYVLKESLGHLDTQGRFINVSDGGHIENLALFELLRRRCRFIIAIDGERDSEMHFGGLVKLMIYARIDLGIEIDIPLDPIRKDEQGVSSKHWAIGTIRYGDGETGHLLYIKSSLTGDEYEYIRKYRSENPIFPHESTAEQFFTETRFEAYRGLGYHIGDELFSDNQALGHFQSFKQQAAEAESV